jgi:hypothetical protein
MDFVNQSKVAAGWTMGFERDGRELIVVAIKATFVMPKDGREPELAEDQAKLIEADEFLGEPGLSAPRYETDYAHRKPFCDVLINGSAYAPDGKATRQVGVGVRVGSMVKTFAVTGNRVWRGGMVGVSASTPEPFESMPISYNNAFGGVDERKGDPSSIKTYLQNPIGRGYSHYKKDLDGKPLPNTEEIGKPIEDPNGRYRPMSFGPIGRNWQPRVHFAGTYDQKWLDHRAPFWPDDFDDRYFQAAPPDQQIPYPTGGEDVVLKNLTTDGHVHFKLPTLMMPVLIISHRGPPQEIEAMIDTMIIEPDLGRFSLTWRVSYALRKSCFDLMRVVAGKTSKEWFGRQRFGRKPYYKNLAEMIRAKAGRNRPPRAK